MANLAKQDNYILQFFLFIQASTTIFCIEEYLGYTFTGRLLWFTSIYIIYFYCKGYTLSATTKIYIAAITLGFFFHSIAGFTDILSFNGTVLARIIPVLILSATQQQTFSPKIFIKFIFLFYFVECGLALYEKLTLTHIINFKNMEDFAATTVIMLDSSTFRSFSLMLHPLYNANIVSIFLAFILCSNSIKPLYKYLLIALGLFALWSFNSRGAMIVWSILLIYRIVLYRVKLIYVLIAVGVLYFVLPPIIEWILYSGVFGRLTEMDFSDSSSLTRIEAFDVFFNERWSWEDIVLGGRMLCYPGTELTLENGILLDLGYWGLIFGTIKVICEILITYFAVIKYNLRDRIFIMIAVWGVAFMNNNSSQTWLLTMFILICVSFNNYMLFRKTF